MRLRNLAFPLCAALGLTLAVATRATAADDNKCTVATKGDSPTAKACAHGGRKEATKVMKEMVKAAKAKGVKFTCDDCHGNMDDYKLTGNASKDYEKLLAATKK